MMCIVANEEGEEGRGVTEGVTVYRTVAIERCASGGNGRP
jgi:hypothetical protein